MSSALPRVVAGTASNRHGLCVMHEHSGALPIVDLEITARTGAVCDPPGREGLARLTGRVLRMGTGRSTSPQIEERVAHLGARLSFEAAPGFVRLHGTVLKRNVQPFAELMAKLVREPAFRSKDLSQAKRETLADLASLRDSDRDLAGLHFRHRLFEGHLYGRPVSGTQKTIRAIRRKDLAEYHARHFVRSNLLFAAAGDITSEEVQALTDAFYADLPKGRAPKTKLAAPKRAKGRRVVIVDKPERAQTQLIMGTLGARASDPDLIPLSVANTAFGGTFTARLMNEVRSKRGWSYGAYSRLGQDRQRDAWYMWTFPAAKDAVACAELQLGLFERFVDAGITAKELSSARRYLANSYCFHRDTAAKRLDQLINQELLGLPEDFYKTYVRKVRGVRRNEANEAIRRRLSHRDMLIVVVATADDVRAGFEALPGVTSVDVVPFDRDLELS